MGVTKAHIKIYDKELKKHLEITIIVDTGSIYTWIKRRRLESLGIRPTKKRKFRLINGDIIEREIGEAVIECLGEIATTIVVFAEEKDNEVLGLHALEGLGLEVDPIENKIKKSEALLAL